MRLTLRTLLAYRDGVLDPKDAAALEAKIKDSSTAKRIAERIEEEMRNRKLAPIPVDAREFGFEANMVAEFLDDTISMESLPEMERKCLENNSLLSELGSCHQILTRALSIPMPISASLRQRIRELPNQPASAFPTQRSDASKGTALRIDPPLKTAGVASKSSSEPVAKPVRKAVELRGTGIELHDKLGHQVPEYLIGNDRSWVKQAMLAAGLLIALIVIGAMAVGPLERVNVLLRKSGAIANGQPQPKDIGAAAANSELKKKPDVKKAPLTEEEGDIDIVEGEAAPPPPSSNALPNPDMSNKSSTGLADNSTGIRSDSVAPPMVNRVDSATKNNSSTAAKRMQWLPEDKSSSESIVLCLAEASGGSAWKRMNPGELMPVGQRVVVPPMQRTEIRIEPGIRMLCAGENDFELVEQGSGSVLLIESGRCLLFATPDAQELQLDAAGVPIKVRFASADASCALEIQNRWGELTEEMIATSEIEIIRSVQLTGVQGTCSFTSNGPNNGGKQGTVTVGQVYRWQAGALGPVQELEETPWWFRTSIERPIDQHAAADLQRALVGVDAGKFKEELAELANHRRSETAALAIRTRMMLGQFDHLFEPEGIFNRKGMHSHWSALLAQLPQSLGRQEHRAKFVKNLQEAEPSRFASLLSLLVPKTNEQLEKGADKLLVEALASPSMDERVLAIYQLANITGKTLGYHAEKNQAEAVQQWRKLLAKNEIRYAETATPSMETNR